MVKGSRIYSILYEQTTMSRAILRNFCTIFTPQIYKAKEKNLHIYEEKV